MDVSIQAASWQEAVHRLPVHMLERSSDQADASGCVINCALLPCATTSHRCDARSSLSLPMPSQAHPPHNCKNSKTFHYLPDLFVASINETACVLMICRAIGLYCCCCCRLLVCCLTMSWPAAGPCHQKLGWWLQGKPPCLSCQFLFMFSFFLSTTSVEICVSSNVCKVHQAQCRAARCHTYYSRTTAAALSISSSTMPAPAFYQYCYCCCCCL